MRTSQIASVAISLTMIALLLAGLAAADQDACDPSGAACASTSSTDPPGVGPCGTTVPYGTSRNAAASLYSNGEYAYVNLFNYCYGGGVGTDGTIGGSSTVLGGGVFFYDGVTGNFAGAGFDWAGTSFFCSMAAYALAPDPAGFEYAPFDCILGNPVIVIPALP